MGISKKRNTGKVVKGIGQGLTAAGGVISMTGIGAPIGAIVSGIGTIASGVGGKLVNNANQTQALLNGNSYTGEQTDLAGNIISGGMDILKGATGLKSTDNISNQATNALSGGIEGLAQTNILKLGGMLENNNITQYQGNSHAQGGINLGMTGNQVEGGETRGIEDTKNYVFSDKLKKEGKTFAEISKEIEKKYKGYDNDRLAIESKNKELALLRDEQEIKKQQLFSKRLNNLAKDNPQQFMQMMQGIQQQGQMQQGQMQQGQMQQGQMQQSQFEYGGGLENDPQKFNTNTYFLNANEKDEAFYQAQQVSKERKLAQEQGIQYEETYPNWNNIILNYTGQEAAKGAVNKLELGGYAEYPPGTINRFMNDNIKGFNNYMNNGNPPTNVYGNPPYGISNNNINAINTELSNIVGNITAPNVNINNTTTVPNQIISPTVQNNINSPGRNNTISNYTPKTGDSWALGKSIIKFNNDPGALDVWNNSPNITNYKNALGGNDVYTGNMKNNKPVYTRDDYTRLFKANGMSDEAVDYLMNKGGLEQYFKSAYSNPNSYFNPNNLKKEFGDNHIKEDDNNFGIQHAFGLEGDLNDDIFQSWLDKNMPGWRRDNNIPNAKTGKIPDVIKDPILEQQKIIQQSQQGDQDSKKGQDGKKLLNPLWSAVPNVIQGLGNAALGLGLKYPRANAFITDPDYVDPTRPAQEIKEQYANVKDKQRQLSTGAGNYMSNLIGSTAGESKKLASLYAQYANMNAGIYNQADQFNAKSLNKNAEFNTQVGMREKQDRTGLFQNALEGIATGGNNAINTYYTEKRADEMMKIAGGQNHYYEQDENGKWIPVVDAFGYKTKGSFRNGGNNKSYSNDKYTFSNGKVMNKKTNKEVPSDSYFIIDNGIIDKNTGEYLLKY